MELLFLKQFLIMPPMPIELYAIDISATSQAAAISQALANGCKILNLSVTYFDDKFVDNSGVWCDAANTASQNNAIIFNSAGNSAKKRPGWVNSKIPITTICMNG